VTRGTVVGWAPQQDTDSARIRWWLTAGSILPRRLESTGIPPATPPHGPGAIEMRLARRDHGGPSVVNRKSILPRCRYTRLPFSAHAAREPAPPLTSPPTYAANSFST
jgi:hypothetical protein